MTQAEIMEMAREAGLLPDNSHPAPETRAMRHRSEAVQRFAASVAAKERQLCAQVCELISIAVGADSRKSLLSAGRDSPLASENRATEQSIVAQRCANAIRARGTKEGV